MKKMFFKSLLALGAVTIPLSAGATVLSSCVSTKDLSQTTAAVYWRNFVNENHARLTGNRYNFNSSNLNEDYTLKDYSNLSALYPLSEYNASAGTIDKTQNNYGSYHAYQWLLKTVEDMGYTNLTPTVTYPAAATISSEDKTVNNVNRKVYTITPADGTKYYQHSNYSWTGLDGQAYTVPASVITKTPTAADANLLLQTGIVTQPFLWSGMENATQTGNAPAALNSIGNNLIVTINPDESITTTEEPYDFYIIAHYDSTVKLGAGQAQASWGATDNATAVAVNLAILKYFSNEANRKNLKTRLHIVFDDAEEVGILGSHAFVKQYLDAEDSETSDKSTVYPLLASSWGMINIDTIGGGDYLYLHTTRTKDADGFNTSSYVRDVLRTASQTVANSKNDSSYKFNTHKHHSITGVSDPGGYDLEEGEAPEWVDHSAFYQIAQIPAANIEATNFEVLSAEGAFDGYSQTKNKYAWLTYDHVPIELKETVDDDGETVYVLPDGYELDDLLVKGDIWHSDIDTINWLAEYIGLSRVYKQLDATYEAIVKMLTTVTPEKTDSSYNNSSSTTK